MMPIFLILFLSLYPMKSAFAGAYMECESKIDRLYPVYPVQRKDDLRILSASFDGSEHSKSSENNLTAQVVAGLGPIEKSGDKAIRKQGHYIYVEGKAFFVPIDSNSDQVVIDFQKGNRREKKVIRLVRKKEQSRFFQYQGERASPNFGLVTEQYFYPIVNIEQISLNKQDPHALVFRPDFINVLSVDNQYMDAFCERLSDVVYEGIHGNKKAQAALKECQKIFETEQIRKSIASSRLCMIPETFFDKKTISDEKDSFEKRSPWLVSALISQGLGTKNSANANFKIKKSGESGGDSVK